MLRRLSPYLMVLLAVIVDTAILPVFYYGTYTVSLTLAVVLCASLVLGRLKGMLLGMIGGLLIDITAGTLGMMTFFDLAVGFLIGFVLNESGPTARRPFGAWFHLRHAAAFFACQLAGELVFGVYRYFQTASVDSGVIPHALARCAIFAAAAMLLYPALRRLFAGKKPQPAQATYRKIREVKHF